MNTKNQIAAVIATLLLAAAGAAHAAKDAKDAKEAKEAAPAAEAPAEKAPTKQQTKMATCNKEAREKSLKGDERKQFMSGCLSSKKVAG